MGAIKIETRQRLLQLLEMEPGKYISGMELSEKLGVTRTAVWKNIQALENDGFIISAVKKRGYRLESPNDTITEVGLLNTLGENSGFSFDVRDEVTSTNLVLKEQAAQLPTWRVVIAGRQSAGRGRLGRSFWSPAGTGLYISVLLRPNLTAEGASLITTAAAVAVCGAVEDCGGGSPVIKWVNDVYLNGKKICGILTEASFNIETWGMDFAVLGVGINVVEPKGGFPEELRNIAGAVFPESRHKLRQELAANFLRRFRVLYDTLEDRGFVEEYRHRSFLIGQPVYVLRPGSRREATALDVDENCHLLVQYTDGTVESLSSGEVSVRPVKGGLV